ncbi:hypothetical protein N480_05890 [Pseudoalteromonas luteoviolacea S2607]|uniref:MATE family efflux transporter n=1 Tax=Pseudoalteromonas luteoviolacea TaxID=43657 RepID=UPI0007B09B1A|nr:MATE family efflux transporter [Pseudoalteromonas luteoviolacea]KZN30485.1 hypothetical protein N480_05890 [Pseudoalteromonas luteoviolacea S2607]
MASRKYQTPDGAVSSNETCQKQRARAVRKRWILTGSTSAVLGQLTTPMLFAILALFGADLIELYFASRLGVDELTAMSFTLPIQATVFAFAIGLGIVVATRLTQARKVEELAAVSLIFTAIVGVLLAVIIWFNLLPILNLLGFDETVPQQLKVWPTLKTYMQYRLSAVVLFFIIMVVFGLLRAFGNMRAAAWLLVTFSAAQVLMSALLFSPVAHSVQLSGLEKLGIAHFFAASIGCIYALFLLVVKENISIKVNLLSQKSRAALRCLIRLSVPVVAMQLLTPIAQSLLMGVVATQGNDAVAAYGVVMRLEPIALLLPMVLTTSLPIFVGQNWEAKKALRVRRGVKLAVVVCVVWQLVIATLLFLGADMLSVGFCKQSDVKGAINFAVSVLPISYVALAAVMLYVSCCNAIGRSGVALNFSIVRLFVLSVPSAYIGAAVAGFHGIVWGLTLSNFILGVCLVLYSAKKNETLSVQKKVVLS